MIQEAYCSFEVAKLLNEKGFNEPCLSYFWTEENGANVDYCDIPFTNKQLYSGQTLRPTHQMACAWLREEKNIHIDIYYLPIHKKYMWSIVETKDPKSTGSKETYEEAVETALKYSLENLL